MPTTLETIKSTNMIKKDTAKTRIRTTTVNPITSLLDAQVIRPNSANTLLKKYTLLIQFVKIQ